MATTTTTTTTRSTDVYRATSQSQCGGRHPHLRVTDRCSCSCQKKRWMRRRVCFCALVTLGTWKRKSPGLESAISHARTPHTAHHISVLSNTDEHIMTMSFDEKVCSCLSLAERAETADLNSSGVEGRRPSFPRPRLPPDNNNNNGPVESPRVRQYGERVLLPMPL